METATITKPSAFLRDYPHKTADVNGKKIAYIDEGDASNPVILFGHSFLWNGAMWQPQIDALKTQYRCIAPDLWGHGYSGNLTDPEAGYSIKQIADDYARFLTQVGIEKCFVVGLSVGGMWGTQLALDYPEKVQGLVIMDTYVGPEPNESLQLYLGMMQQITSDQGFSADMIATVLPFFFSPENYQHNHLKLVTNFGEYLASIPAEQVPSIVTLGEAIFRRESLLNRLSELNMPVQVMVGAQDLPRPPAESQDMFSRLSKEINATLVEVPNAGHIANRENAAFVTEKLTEFLQGVSG